MKRFLTVSLMAAALMTGTAVAADYEMSTPAGGAYFSGFIGASFPPALDPTQDVAPPGEQLELDLGTGYSLDGALGYDFGNGLMIEGQLGFLSSNTGDLSIPGFGITTDTDGRLNVTYAMANAWYGLDIGYGISPFLGGGIGYSWLDVEATYPLSGSPLDDTASAFAWQLGAGAMFDVTDQISVMGRYRYLDTSEFTIQDDDGTDVTGDFNTHIVDIGLKFKF